MYFDLAVAIRGLYAGRNSNPAAQLKFRKRRESPDEWRTANQTGPFSPLPLVECGAIGEGTRIWAFAHVMKGARVGAGCNLGEGVFVERGVSIGDNVTVKNGVALYGRHRRG
jgi:NDP-sugar pyrophosphorylase family protein